MTNANSPLLKLEKHAGPIPVAIKPSKEVLILPQDKQWNTKNLGLRLCSDFVAALSAGGLVAPVIAIIDR